MFELEIHHEGRIRYIKTDGKDLLLQVLRHEGYDIYAPCGGNGTCGKCKVWTRGEGSVSSCVFPVSNHLKVILPDKKEAQILVAQHEHTVKLPFMPGSAANLSSYPHGVAIAGAK